MNPSDYQPPPKLFYIIDREPLELLGQYTYNGHSIIDPPNLYWSSYGHPDLMDVETLRLKIKETDGSYTDRTITICVGAYRETAKDFLAEHAQQVQLTTTMLAWKHLEGKPNSLGSLPIEIMKVILDKSFLTSQTS